MRGTGSNASGGAPAECGLLLGARFRQRDLQLDRRRGLRLPPRPPSVKVHAAGLAENIIST
jgi:hypothetical protein